MAFLLQLSPKDARLAGRVGTLADLQNVRLLESSFVRRGTASTPTETEGRGAETYEVSVSTTEHGEVTGSALVVAITVRLVCTTLARRGRVEVVRCRCRFELEYSLPPGAGVSEKEVKAFSKTNALLNAWPYWREFVHSMASRAGMPPLVAPLLKMVPRRSAKGATRGGGRRPSSAARALKE